MAQSQFPNPRRRQHSNCLLLAVVAIVGAVLGYPLRCFTAARAGSNALLNVKVLRDGLVARAAQEADTESDPQAEGEGEEEGADDETLRRVFFQMDSNADGLIDEAEFLEAMSDIGTAFARLSKEEEKEIFEIADTDKDGKINVEDFGKWVTLTKENLAYFQLVDSDSDGCITWEEWCTVIAKMELDLTEETIKRAFQKADVDGNGLMSFMEFLKYMNGVEKKVGILKRTRTWFSKKFR